MSKLPARTRVIVTTYRGVHDGSVMHPRGSTPDLPTGLALDLERFGLVRLMPWLAPRPPRPEPRVRRPLPGLQPKAEEDLPRYTVSDPDDELLVAPRARRKSTQRRRRPLPR